MDNLPLALECIGCGQKINGEYSSIESMYDSEKLEKGLYYNSHGLEGGTTRIMLTSKYANSQLASEKARLESIIAAKR